MCPSDQYVSQKICKTMSRNKPYKSDFGRHKENFSLLEHGTFQRRIKNLNTENDAQQNIFNILTCFPV